MKCRGVGGSFLHTGATVSRRFEIASMGCAGEGVGGGSMFTLCVPMLLSSSSRSMLPKYECTEGVRAATSGHKGCVTHIAVDRQVYVCVSYVVS